MYDNAGDLPNGNCDGICKLRYDSSTAEGSVCPFTYAREVRAVSVEICSKVFAFSVLNFAITLVFSLA